MLSVTNRETQRATPSHQAVLQAVEPQAGKSFADAMQQAQTVGGNRATAAESVQVRDSAAAALPRAERLEAGAEVDVKADDLEKAANPGAGCDVVSGADVAGTAGQAQELKEVVAEVGKAAADVPRPMKAPRQAAAGKEAAVTTKRGKHAAARVEADGTATSGAGPVVEEGFAVCQLQASGVAGVPAGRGKVSPALSGKEPTSKAADATARKDPAVAVRVSDAAASAPTLGSAAEGAVVENAARHDAAQPAAQGPPSVVLEKLSGAVHAVAPGAANVFAEASRGPKNSTATADTATGISAKSHAGALEELNLQSVEVSAKNRLEIGVSGGSWGWLKVRAEMGQSGEVQAFLRGVSSGAEIDLKAQAAGLQAYLGTQQVRVGAVHVEASTSMAWTAGAGDRGQAGSQGNDGPSSRSGAKGRQGMFEPVVEAGSWLPMAQGLHGGGGWLSVLA